MADETNNAAAPAIDPKVLADQVSAAVSAATKPLLETLGGLVEQLKTLAAAKTANAAETTTAEAPAALTLEAVEKLLDAKLTKQQEAATQHSRVKASIDAAATKHLAGIPDVYRSRLSQIDDSAKLEAECKVIREQWQADLKAAGVTAPRVGAQPGAGATAAGGAVDVTKMSPVAKIATMYATKT